MYKKVWMLASVIVCLGLSACQSDQMPSQTTTQSEGEIQNVPRTEEIALPRSYDARLDGRAPKSGDQGSLGTCWAFASLKALESSLLPEYPMEFSVDHMTMHNSFELGQDAGGEYTMSMAYLLAWQGPVREEDDPYGDDISPDGLRPCLHVQEIRILPEKDYEAIKRAVYTMGGVQSSLYTEIRNDGEETPYYQRDKNAYCYPEKQKPNHDSVIIGWDDDYPKENFGGEASEDGAFLCLNSWGEDFGDQGYFYVSYSDANIGVNNISYTGISFPKEGETIYQSDLCGWLGQVGYGEETAWFANAYTAKGIERLSGAGFYATMAQSSYEVYVSRHLENNGKNGLNDRQKVVQGSLEEAGFYSVLPDREIVFDEGEKFAIIVKITTPNAEHPVAVEYDAGDGLARIDLTDGEGYLSYDGEQWERVEETLACNICLKVYTQKERSTER